MLVYRPIEVLTVIPIEPRNLLRLPLKTLACVFLLSLVSTAGFADDERLAEDYFPPRGDWARVDPETAGFNAARLAAAIDLAQERAVLEPRELSESILDTFGDEPNFRILGPTGTREAAAGLIIRGGKIAAEWGDLERVEMTFSVVKSYLSTVAALAWADGLIGDVNDPVGKLVRGDWFASEHNRQITWHHLLNQTSDWSGTLWDVPDWADRPEGDDPAAWPNRVLNTPGTTWKYNDVRINLLAYGLLEVLREPLPVVLRERIMDPIGASPTWRWTGYENSWVELDGRRLQSVSGGGHFGGGLFINSYDHARFGLLFLRGGRWAGEQLVPEAWLDLAREPTPQRTDYGYLWWLNTGQERIPAAPASAYWAAGFGGNYIYIDEEHDLLVVLRWIPALEEVITAIMAALEP
ncbi:MAG: serine hydrolase [Xanthomonadales bacterium]|nr:serine hydrolase [Xanthomonadales bacterium]